MGRTGTISSLTGIELMRQKAKRVVTMGGRYPHGVSVRERTRTSSSAPNGNVCVLSYLVPNHPPDVIAEQIIEPLMLTRPEPADA